MGNIDLHTHSTASDGTSRPAELIREAQAAGLSALALTDHDTVAGLEEAAAEAERLGVEFVPGVELSAESPGYPLHLLGLWLPLRPAGLAGVLEDLRRKREERNHAIIERLRERGLKVTYAELEALAAEGSDEADEGRSVGRPHIARLLMAKGYVTHIQEAFARYLGSWGSAYVPKAKLTAERAIALLKAEGALAIMAHPCLVNLSLTALERELSRYRDMGLDGLEVYYTEHSDQQTRDYLRLARKLGLAVTGGTDYHGAIKPDIKLGRGKGKGKLKIPYSVLADLKAYRAERGLAVSIGA